MTLTEIREARAAKVAEARSLLDTESLTADQKAAFDKLKADIESLEADERRAQFLEEAERRALSGDKNQRKLEKRISVLDAIAAQVEQRSVTGALAEFQQEAKRQGVEPRHGGVLVPASVFEKRDTNDPTYMSTGDVADIVPEDFRADQFIGLLRNSAIIRSLGATVLSGLRGDTVLPKQTGASTAFWIAEGDPLTDSDLTFDSTTLKPKHVGALTSLSRQLIQQANPSIEQLVRNDFVQVIGLAIDKALIHGNGATEPLGILNYANKQGGSLATPSWAEVVELFEKLQLINATPTGILTHPEAATKLATTLKDASAGSEYLLQGGRINNTAVHVTNQLDEANDTHGSGQLILGDFSQIVIGQWGATEILANPYAPDYYERGAVQLRILATMDAVARHENAFVVVDDI